MPERGNLDVLTHVLKTLFNISRRKTTEGYAVITMENVIKKLSDKYEFLKNIEIKDTRFDEIAEPIMINTDVNTVESTRMGNALNDIIRNINTSLGDDAGHFFIKEIQTGLGDEYSTTIKDMGVDLGLLQLENEIHLLEKRLEKK